MRSSGMPEETKQTQFRWIVVGLIFFITVVNYIDRSFAISIFTA
jgi:hypothetical protein